MIVGKYMGKVKSNYKIFNLIRKNLGHLDLHTQMRTKPLIKYIITNKNVIKNKNILEIGCGEGNNCFEIFFNSEYNNIIGFDLNETAINSANKIADELGISNRIKFYYSDATKYDYSSIGNIDLLLLIDFLEHISDPKSFLESIKNILDDKSEIIVSVPTYLYKKVFGEYFHVKVGHVKDGYSLAELNVLFSNIGYKPKLYSYNTGIFGNVGCFLYYRLNFNNKYLNLLKQLVLYPFSFIDFINNKYISSSLFVVYEKAKK